MQNSYILLFSNYGQTWPNRVYIHKHKQWKIKAGENKSRKVHTGGIIKNRNLSEAC